MVPACSMKRQLRVATLHVITWNQTKCVAPMPYTWWCRIGRRERMRKQHCSVEGQTNWCLNTRERGIVCLRICQTFPMLLKSLLIVLPCYMQTSLATQSAWFHVFLEQAHEHSVMPLPYGHDTNLPNTEICHEVLNFQNCGRTPATYFIWELDIMLKLTFQILRM